jgi:cholesterol transport system auxiliary component
MKKMIPLLALALSACMGFGGGKAPDQLLTLTPAVRLSAEGSRTAQASQAVTVVPPTVPQELNTLRVPVRSGATSVAYLKDAQWVEMPSRLFGRVLSETIAGSTGRVVLDPSQFTLDPGIRLTGQLQSFGLDANSMEVVAVYDAALMRSENNVETRRFEARVPVSEDKVGSVAPALNQAANQIAGQVAEWVG